jgi:hypothetical protein
MSVAATVIVPAADAGETVQASTSLFPAATTTVTPALDRALAAAFKVLDLGAPIEILATDLSNIFFALASL